MTVQILGWQYSKNVLGKYMTIFSLLLNTFHENQIYDYDVLETLFIKYEIHGPWVRSSGTRVGSKWPYSDDVLQYCSLTVVGDKLNECYDFHKSPLPELLNSWPSRLSGGANISEYVPVFNFRQFNLCTWKWKIICVYGSDVHKLRLNCY